MDLILINGNIITMNPSYPKAEALAIKDGLFTTVGSKEDVLSFKKNSTEIIDLKGRTLLPGFIDSHIHLVNYGYSLQHVDLNGLTSIDDVIEKMISFIKDQYIQKDKWIIGRGWNQDDFTTKKFPTRYDLDKISKNHPICIVRACGHIMVGNSKALKLAGISKSTLQVEGGFFDLDEEGNPLGIFRETAMNLLYNQLTEPSLDEIKKMILSASNRIVKQGITSVQSDDFDALPGHNFQKVISAYTDLKDSKKLPLRVYQQCLLPTLKKLKHFLQLGYSTGYGDSMYKIGPLKLRADGSLGARTAYLREPYADAPWTSGLPVFMQEELDALIIAAHNGDMQTAVHCIGDKTMYMALQSIEKAQKQNPRNHPRHGIVHCQVTDEGLLHKCKDLDIIAYIQPIFIDSDLHMVEQRLGNTREKSSYNWKNIYNKGISVACGSDCPFATGSPVDQFNVLLGIYTAVTRKDLSGYPDSGWLPDQKLSLMEAIHGFTLGAAYASFDEKMKGSIEVGKLADLVVLSDDIFKVPPDEIKNISVLATFVGGELKYLQNGTCSIL
ncbi:amidohydrolase [Clostridium formicaceticum]|uniref:N-substituted formamide deformylase n=1 Tax=Clostridium formicaceticum TaxID=1497 RepID=A0AAC9RGB4_9CLOT|nr:amidohydrolase [Clostridium formicaceticum]AOY75967.1 hypothetical protein BJL90_08685 [Clostridium formicaceticum]ARE86316.1 N-substituted formamide deformylase precursor [Clostridium formicaceticum]